MSRDMVPGLSLAWDQRGKPVAGHSDPVQVFHKLFSADEMPLEQRQAAIAENCSVLDAVLSEARARAARSFEDRHRQARRIIPGHPGHRDTPQQGRRLA